jgi:hypothetical protein
MVRKDPVQPGEIFSSFSNGRLATCRMALTLATLLTSARSLEVFVSPAITAM